MTKEEKRIQKVNDQQQRLVVRRTSETKDGRYTKNEREVKRTPNAGDGQLPTEK